METNTNELGIQAKQTFTALMETLEAFTPETFNRVPPLGGWTAGQVCEHLLLSAGVVEVIAGKTQTPQRPANQKVEAIAAVFLDFNTKLQSPDFVIPAAGDYDQQISIQRLKTAWTKLREAVRLLDLNALCVDFELPVMGQLTRLEWIWFYVFHTQRHVRQLERLLTPAATRHRLPLPGR
ncbi:MAG TPA: DinB family protein [Puia sp.]|nr:DinB family protein [Puia sp.]